MKHLKKVEIVFLCMAVVITCMIPMVVSARAGVHSCVAIRKGIIQERYISKSSDQHEVEYTYDYRCQSCDAHMYYKAETELQSHVWNGPYDDLGHSSAHYHNYRVRCSKCGASREVSILCDVDALGHHITP